MGSMFEKFQRYNLRDKMQNLDVGTSVLSLESDEIDVFW